MHLSNRPVHTFFLCFAIALLSCESTPVVCADKSASADVPVQFQHAAVAADHPLASRAGIEILKQGGNLVDAAVATSFALSVLRPESSGIGGGGFMVIWNAERGEAVALDYREKAPLRSSRSMFAPEESPAADVSRTGALAAAVPGQVAGLCYALKRYGTLDLRTVLAPAIRLSVDGIPLDPFAVRVQEQVLAVFDAKPAFRKRFAPLYELYLNRGAPWSKEARFHSPQRRVLEMIAEQGADAFYQGSVAHALVNVVQQDGGIWTLEDLASMRPVARLPVRGRFGDFDIVTMPPPSSGGIALVEMLNIVSAYEAAHPDKALDKLGHNSVDYLHLLTEVMKHAFADRAAYLGDQDFAPVPVKRLTGRRHAEQLARKIDMAATLPLEAYGRNLPVDDAGTTHFSLIDDQGNAVACTETINSAFGSLLVEPTYGIALNNEMDDFAALPGQPNQFGLMQSKANAVEPGKRPLSSMTPTIVLKNGKAVHVLGASGGPRIISSVLEVLLNLTRFNMDPRTAVDKPRAHHQWLPNTLYVEAPLFEKDRAALAERGHSVAESEDVAACQVVSKAPDGIRAASDPRKGGRPAGY